MTSAADLPAIPVFIDASVWIAAAASPSGESSLVLEMCGGRRFAAVCSQRVLLEAQRNIREKMTADELARFYRLLAAASPSQTPSTSPEEDAEFADLASPKDAHVLAAAVRSEAASLITLDRKHLANDRVRAAGLPLGVLTPGEFIRTILGESLG